MQNDDGKKILSPNQKKSVVGASVAVGTVYTFATGILSSDLVLNGLHNLVHNQVAQAGALYMAGQYLHNVMVRKNFGKFQGEVLESVNNLSQTMKSSLDGVTEALKKDLANKASREEVQAGFDKVNGRIDGLEANMKPKTQS